MVKNIFIQMYWFLSSQAGVDLRLLFRSLQGVPKFIRDWLKFRKGYFGKLIWKPCLHDWYEEGGSTRNEYFSQDLLVAQMIFNSKPERHVDIGSRVDGFVAHVASFRDVEVFDVRKVTAQIPGIIFKQADLMKSVDGLFAYCDSLSCLHALEHFGLGRYGDPIDSMGYEKGIANMASLLKPGGKFYLSTPIGKERVEFNAHRVFNPLTIINHCKRCGLRLFELSVISQDGTVDFIQDHHESFLRLAGLRYTLGVFVFIKLNI